MQISNMTSYLEGLEFPARHGEMLRHARGNDAPSNVLDRLKAMDDGTYQSVEEIKQALREKADAEES